MRRPSAGRLVAVLVVVGCLALVPVAAATTPISGTITVEDGSADGTQVEVVPLSRQGQRSGDSVTATVDGSSFAVDAPDAPRYAVRIAYGGATHYELLQNRTRVDITLAAHVSGRVVAANGTPERAAVIELVDQSGFVVDTYRTNASGRFAFGPLEPDESYQLRVRVDGAAYRRTIDPTAVDSVEITALPPTDDASVLAVANRSPTGHVVQLVAPQNASGAPSAIETIALANRGDRPFAGAVTVRLPDGASPYAAMVGGERTEYRRTDAGVRVNVSIPANGSIRVGAAYDLDGTTFRKRVGRDTPSLAVVLRGYDPAAVSHSGNLRSGSAPIPMLVTSEPLDAGDAIRVDLAGARTNASASTGGSRVETSASESASIPPFPGVAILGGIVGAVLAGLGAYRVTRSAPSERS